MTLSITYAIEQTDAGWLVWRTLHDGSTSVVGPLWARAWVPHTSRRDAAQTVARARLADRAAATRLGVTVEHP